MLQTFEFEKITNFLLIFSRIPAFMKKLKCTMQELQYCEFIDFQRRAGFSFITDDVFFVLLLVVGHAVQASINCNETTNNRFYYRSNQRLILKSSFLFTLSLIQTIA